MSKEKELAKARMKAVVVSLLIFLLIPLVLSLTVGGCTSEQKYIYHVTRKNPDGTVENWVVRGSVGRSEGFAYWQLKNGAHVYVSGAVTIEPVLVVNKTGE